MSVFLVLIVFGVIFAAAAVAVGHGAPMAAVYPDRAPFMLPEDGLGTDDLQHVRFPVSFRGYRMEYVDTVLDRAAAEITRRDERIAELERQVVSLNHVAPAGAAGPGARDSGGV